MKKFAALFFLSLAPLGQAGSSGHFEPEHRVSGIGVARDDISRELLDARTNLMIQSQTFSIMREPLAIPGAKRITADKRLQAIFKTAASKSGLPATLIEAIAYLESWGDSRAESSTGPKGIMQIAGATAREMGLRVVQSTRYHVSKERVHVSGTGKKARYRTITHRTPYTVTVRDDRLSPDRAIPAAAVYLAGMQQKFGGLDWAIFAYHCGQGCVATMLDLTRHARGIPKDEVSVPRMFFSCNPAWNHELYEAIEQQMQRDYSPTYYFRVMRAEQLLAMYRRDPAGFVSLAQEYRSDFYTGVRAPYRLAVWLKRDDLVYKSCQDIRADLGKRLFKAFDRPDYFGYRLHLDPTDSANLDAYSQASPAAIGTLMYISYETRRLFDEVGGKHEKFEPLTVTSLVESTDDAHQDINKLAHCSGQVFDLDYSGLPPVELECLRFVLDDLGWNGYLGFIEEGRGSLHIGCSPTSREFFTSIFNEAVGG
ncbi:MAG TPA: transglycosylase SLT domain-containing protein [Candidatus Limnocylindrales bacterium]|nr:transglycosylase SLT domain-containing protein [Candidatus Limnocylindrales bacterium]